ncbi:MAG: AAA family ATPase [Acidimicrobiaceae bacterium]|nr:AAA family ATPase [Acidimicrobiaceae bacterium]
MTGAMSNDSTTDQLHLPDLSITNFRGIEDLTIPRLGRVTLITGRNGVGKTTVLEAVRVYAARGRSRLLDEMLWRCEEFVGALDEDDDPEIIPDFKALFYGREPEQGSAISIGPRNEHAALTIQLLAPSVWTKEQPELFPDFNTDDDVWALKIRFRESERTLPWLAIDEFQSAQARRRPPRRIWNRWATEGWPEPTNCQTLGPGLMHTQELAGLWSNVALTEEEDRATEALQLLQDGIERIAIVGSAQRMRQSQRVIVKFAGQGSPVPLKSLGDGAVRIFGVALALANSQNGFLVIDEAENGIHHTAQRDFWRLLLRTAQRNNVQVLATTHSWDCVAGFARAACELDDVEGVLVRLEEDEDGLRAVEYTESDLAVAAEQRIEVR